MIISKMYGYKCVKTSLIYIFPPLLMLCKADVLELLFCIGQKISDLTFTVNSVAQQPFQEPQPVQQGKGTFRFSCSPALG